MLIFAFFSYVMPKGGFFGSVVMPHYGFEALAWLGWNIALNHVSWPAIAFFAIGFMGMFTKAKEKRAVYLKKFDGANGTQKYPESNKLMFPLLL